MTDTINNGIPFVPENTVDPAAGLNLSLNVIDALLQLSVASMGQTTPPAGIEGERHIVGVGATGDWTGQDNKLARYLDGMWHFYDAKIAVYDGKVYAFDGTTWTTALVGDDLKTINGQSIIGSGDLTVTGVVNNLNDVGDVDAPTPSDGDALIYNSVSGNWEAAPQSGGVTSVDYAAAPFGNLLADGGRYDGGSGGLSVGTPGPFSNNNLFTTYNGSTVSEAGKFIFDNNDFGGSAGNMTTTTIDLLSFLGRSGNSARYGVEFYIAEYTAGSGTTAPAVFNSGTKYLMAVNSFAAIFGNSSTSTFQAKIRAVGDVLGIRDNNDIYINGVRVGGTGSSVEIHPSDGWVDVRVVTTNTLGYAIGFPFFYSTNGNGFQCALPFLAHGYADTGMHTTPIPARNLVL